MNEAQLRQEGVNIAFNQLSPLLYEQAETIERLREEGEVKVVKNEVKTKQVSFDLSGDMDFKFDDVQLDNYGQVAFTTFDFSIFKGISEEIEKIESEFRLIESNGIYSKDYVLDKRVEALGKIVDVKNKYHQKAKEQLATLRKPVMTSSAMSDSSMLNNLLKRLNNNVVASELMRTATIEDLVSLYEHNKENVEVRTMIKSRAFHLYRITKDSKLKDKALKLYSQIKQFEKELKREDYFTELDSIEFNLDFIFSSKNNSNYYPLGLENGFSGYRSKRMFS